MSRPAKGAYRAPPELLRLFPDISGNEINGLGVSEKVRPRHVYWHRPEQLAHGALQAWMIARFAQIPELRDVTSQFGGRGPKPEPIADRRREAAPADWADAVKAFARENEADLVGIAAMDPLWVYDGYTISEPWIVMLGIAMDHGRLATAPTLEATIEVQAQYNRGARAARALSNWIRRQGWSATPHAGPMAGAVNLIPAALAAGLGELGKHGSIINDELGSSFRLAGVVTDLPLIADRPRVFGADDFCLNCRVCSDACPPAAIFETKQVVRGERKWYVDFDKCLPYFNETLGCGICIAVCPWSRPGVAPNLADKMARRRRRRESGA